VVEKSGGERVRPRSEVCQRRLRIWSPERSMRRRLMHAVVVKVTVNDVQTAEKNLQEHVLPRIKQMPGFMTGYWTRSEGQGLSMVIFQSEENARQAADQVQANMPPGDAVTFESAEVREVVAQA
jgi:hypothetical protein